jgi:SAM-dependent methyltransferase
MSWSAVRKAATQPKRVLPAIARRVAPRSRFGPSYILRSNGYVTFRSDGFVASDGVEGLLARHNYEIMLIRQLLSDVRVDRSLELGCGFGRLSPWIAEHSMQHVAIDVNQAALAGARASYARMHYIAAAADSLPFPRARFGLVCSWTVLQHVRPDRIDNTAVEVVRLLAPGGLLLLCEETRHLERNDRHTWHRPLEYYEALFAPLALQWNSYIHDIDRIPGLESPGRVMLFTKAGDMTSGRLTDRT